MAIHASGSSSDIYGRIKSAWDKSAAQYDRSPGHGLLSGLERQAWTTALASALAPLQADGRLRIVDVGTGTGVMALLLAEMGHTVIGVDISSEMLGRAREKALHSGLDVTFVEGNAAHLPFEAGTADVVFARHVFWTLPSPIKTLREWKRVARQGGIVAIADGWWNEPSPAMRRRRAIGAMIRRVLARGHDDHHGNAALRSKLPVADGVSPYSIRYFLDQAGLERLKVADLKMVRDAERRSLPPWYWIDRPRYTWLATGYKPS